MQFAREGEELSKKQAALESSTKKLRSQLKDAEHARKETETSLLIEQQKVGRPLPLPTCNSLVVASVVPAAQTEQRSISVQHAARQHDLHMLRVLTVLQK